MRSVYTHASIATHTPLDRNEAPWSPGLDMDQVAAESAQVPHFSIKIKPDSRVTEFVACSPVSLDHSADAPTWEVTASSDNINQS